MKMVAWKIVVGGNEVEVVFDVEEEVAWKDFKMKGYGVAALEKLPIWSQASGNVLKALPTIETDTQETKKRRHLSLPELYYAVAIDGVLSVNEPLGELWERFTSATFTRNFVVYQHFRRLGWILRPGLNYGAHYVLYRGSGADFHSEYVVYVQDEGQASSWNQIQSLTRIAADVKKTVLLCTVAIEEATADLSMGNDVSRTVNSPATGDSDLTFGTYSFHGIQYAVNAIAIRFWDTTIANEPRSYTFLPQPVLPKKNESAKKKRVKRPSTVEGEVHRGLEDST